MAGQGAILRRGERVRGRRRPFPESTGDNSDVDALSVALARFEPQAVLAAPALAQRPGGLAQRLTVEAAQRSIGNRAVQRLLGATPGDVARTACQCAGAAGCATCRGTRTGNDREGALQRSVDRVEGGPLERSVDRSIPIQRGWEAAASETACALLNDDQIYGLFTKVYFREQPNARKHLEHYRFGAGADYKEDVATLFAANPRVRSRIVRLIQEQIDGGASTRGSLVGTGVDDGESPPIRQRDYDSEDWRNANGNIDQVDWEIVGTFDARKYNRVKITVRDPYTWHPLENRPTQCLHAAFERMKAAGAADYMTMGTAEVLLPPVAQSPDLPIESVL